MLSTPPLAIYIHWPFCKAKCPYCDFNSHVRDAVDDTAWQAALLGELDHFAARIPERRVASVFFGGGTPSLMSPATVEALLSRIHARWPVAADLEVTLEANPTSVEAAKLADFKTAGVNRLSMGIQSLRDDALRFLGRQHSAAEACAALETARARFDRLSFDLIYALPDQTPEAWERELSEALSFAGDHLSLYQLTIEENTAFHHAYHAQSAFALPDEDASADLYDLTQRLMDAAGLPAYEVSNHARPGSECRHNLAYWRGEDYLGIGPGAHGRLTEHGARIATATIKSPEVWLSRAARGGHGLETDMALTMREWFEERLMMGMRLSDGLALDQLMHEIPSAETFLNRASLARMEQAGWLTNADGQLVATSAGRLVLTRLTAELLTDARYAA